MRPLIPKEEQECAKKKLLSYCDDDQCPHKHEGVTPVERYFLLDVHLVKCGTFDIVYAYFISAAQRVITFCIL